MSSSLNKVEFTRCMITPNDKKAYLKKQQELLKKEENNTNKGDLEEKKNETEFPDLAKQNLITSIDYFEDLLSPSVTCYLQISDTTNILSRLPIRGYERVDLEVAISESQTFKFNEDNTPLFVTSIENVQRTESQETFVMALSTVGNLRNEISRCTKRYERANVRAHVESILKEQLKIDEGRIHIDNTSTQYTFFGCNKKPFFVITSLAPKTQPIKEGDVNGTSGFVFYEDHLGYHFKSVDSLLEKADEEVRYLNDPSNLDKPPRVPEMTYTTAIDRAESPENQYKILDHFLDKTVNIQKNLRVGLYSNLTITIDPLSWDVKTNIFKLKDNVNDENGMKTSGPEVPIPVSDVFDGEPSRRLVRMLDSGMIDKKLEKDEDGKATTSGRDPEDMAKSFSRYSLLFQQSLNITIPCNIDMRGGGVVKVVLPGVGPSEQGDGGKEQKEADPELSGIYLIRAVRHHFELGEGRNVTSLNLIRDSYGVN